MFIATETISDENLCASEDICYFDIETTGLSRDLDHIFMISLLKAVNNSLTLTQLLCDDVTQEDDCIRGFFTHIGSCNTLAHFGGTSFDIPFIKAKLSSYSLPYGFDGYTCFDVGRGLKPFQLQLGCSDMRQLTVENIAGFERDDTVKPQLIMSLYARYIGYRKLAGFDMAFAPELEEYRSLLLGHARNDLLGLLHCHALLRSLI
jgi:uncharacterized protein YprB with RNaseH-like and TPR domain